ncbi:hypothetical protein CSUI_002724 [Cystoisospora suis]|uniref:Uncharacterized protein n=1 Tax=Cystoisospora suis TaxID=483139 RepID=A0A2C6L6Z9_9APIC|nr:hypothetical protein CSUI_002724 [Cystoisospora suis]
MLVVYIYLRVLASCLSLFSFPCLFTSSSISSLDQKEKHKHFWRKTARLAQTQCLTQLDTPSKDFLRQSIVNASLGGGLPVYIEKGVALQIHSLKTSKPVAHIKVVGDHILTSTVLDLMTGLKKMLEESTRKCLERNPIELRWLDMKRSGGKSKKRGIGGANWNAFPIGSGVNTLQFLAQQQWNSLYALAFAFVGVRFRAQRRAAFLLNRWLPETFGGSRGEPWDCLRRDPLFIYAQKSPNFTVVVRVD